MKRIFFTLILGLSVSNAWANGCLDAGQEVFLCETREAKFLSGEALAIHKKASELGGLAQIYEYLRNNAEYSVYHGARSNSINSFLAMEGNDVDLASTLIAMYRSVGVKARYAVGNVKLKREDLSNWLGIENTSLAVSILLNQGVDVVDESDPDYITFEHVWVQVLANFSHYRGANVSPSACASEGAECIWVNLDPSFKLKVYQPEYRNLLKDVAFDYDAYYNAESDPLLKDKNPLEIYEEQSLRYLRENHPGVTLEDVIDSGKVIEEKLAFLPSSLPYQVVGNINTFNSIDEHDNSPLIQYDWNKSVSVHVVPLVEGEECQNIIAPIKYSVADLSTQQLTVNWAVNGGISNFSMEMGDESGFVMYAVGNIGCTASSGRVVSEPFTEELLFNIYLSVEASPFRSPISVTYKQLVAGGYHLIATGGETSNWTQAKRAYSKLLESYKQYPVISDTNGDLYVDEDADGVVGDGDISFLLHKTAQNALTGGLLYAAQSVYLTRLKEEGRRYNRLKNAVTPIAAYAGVISTYYDIDVVDGVPFSVLPGGLLIDLKGLRVNGSWEADKAEEYSSDVFRFVGHIASSLEHEVWQELTGFDAISTVRGFQKAIKDGSQLVSIRNDAQISNVDSALANLDVSETVPADFTLTDYSIFGRDLVAWEYSGGTPEEAGFYFFKKDLSGFSEDDPLAAVYSNYANNDIASIFSSYDNFENYLEGGIEWEQGLNTFTIKRTGITSQLPYYKLELVGSNSGKFEVLGFNYDASTDTETFYLKEKSNLAFGSYGVTVRGHMSVGGVGLYADIPGTVSIQPLTTNLNCSGIAHTDITFPVALTELEVCFNQFATDNSNLLSMLDRGQGFDSENIYYKNSVHPIDEHGIGFISNLRKRMYFPEGGRYYDVQTPEKIAASRSYLFDIYIEDRYTTGGDLVGSAYIIQNESGRLQAGGGYVVGLEAVSAANYSSFLISEYDPWDVGQLTESIFNQTINEFNNEVFTDYNLISIANSDLYRTPSTWDPVSTVTGNMYHDEVDIEIPGKGINYTFTRTYNSNPTKTSGEGSTNPNHYPLSQGWTHSYNMKLVSNDYGQYPNFDTTLAPENENGKVSSITYVDERGGEHNYLLDDEDPQAQPTLPYAGFNPLQLDSPSVGFHTITFLNGVTYIFDSLGQDMRVPGSTARLHEIRDPYGNQLNFNYQNNQLVTITDNLGLAGRTGLVLSYYESGDNVGRLSQVEDWTGRKWQYQYEQGNLSAVVNPLNDAMAYTYHEGTHYVKDIIHPQERDGTQKAMRFSYYEDGRAYNYIDQLGGEESLTYDLFRHRTRITNPRGHITEHYYDANGALIKLVDANKGIMLFENNEDGLRFTKYNALGERTRYSYHSTRDLTGVASDTSGQVTREEDALGNTVDYSYGIHGQITSIKDKSGNVIHHHYYASTDLASGAVAGKLQKTTVDSATVNGVQHANVTLLEYQYYADGALKQKVEYIDPAQPTRTRVTTHNYNYAPDGSFTLETLITGGGVTIKRDDEFDALWRKTKSTVYRRTSATDSTLLALTTEYMVDDLGRITKVIDPIGNISEVIFDKNGKVSQNIIRYKLLAEGNTAIHSQCIHVPEYPDHHSCITEQNEYDAADRLTKSTDVTGASIQYEYDLTGNLTRVINDLGNSLYYRYDAKGQRTHVTDEKGYTVTTEYDLAGRVVSVTDANGSSITYRYDALGRKVSDTTPEGRVTQYDEYDANGNLVRVTDPNGVAGEQPLNAQNASVYNEFDEFNQLVKTLNANNETTAYTYDLLGNRTSVEDAKGQVTNFLFDDLGRLTTIVDPIVESGEDKVVSITYDEAGNRLTYTDRLGEVTRYTYDKLNRLTQEEYLTDGVTAQKVYDQYGDLVKTQYGANAYQYTYDVAHRMLSKTDSRSGRVMSWVYDSVGNVIKKQTFEGEEQKFVYDSSNRLVSMSAGNPVYLQASYHYDPAGRLLSRILSNGAATLYSYSKDGLLTGVKQIGVSGLVIDDRTYQHDKVGNITEMVLNGSETISYNYDPAYRLLAADSSTDAYDFAYTYDVVGNRLTKTSAAGVQHYKYLLGNRLDEVRQDSLSGPLIYRFDYDVNGSMTAKFNGQDDQLLHIEYDQRRLASVMNPAGMADNVTFEYDNNAYRIGKQAGTEAKQYYLEAEHLESVYDNDDTLQASYLRGVVVDEIVNGFERNGEGVLENRTYHHDQVNSLVAVSDHKGDLAQQLRFSPFGESLVNTGSSFNAMQYTGREADIETDLYYYRARYYDPELGRFFSEDPVGFIGGVNFYAYVGNNPVLYNDPKGHLAETPWDGFNVALGGASLAYNISNEDWGWAAVDAIGLGYDLFATAVPFLPAGASAGLKAYRAGNGLVDSVKIGSDVAVAAKEANIAAKNAATTFDVPWGAALEGSRIHRTVGDSLTGLSSIAENAFRGSNGARGLQPDLYWPGSNVWADLTTVGQWGNHVNKYAEGFGTGIPLIYKVGEGLTNVKPLSLGGGVSTFTLQMGDYFLNGGDTLPTYSSSSGDYLIRDVFSK